MDRRKEWWYKLVAGGLLEAYEASVASNKKLSSSMVKQVEITNEHCARWLSTEAELKKLQKEVTELVTEKMKLKDKNPLARAIDTVRHNAAQQRIRELEDEVRVLRDGKKN
jgi:TolA-binding protein